MPTVSDYASLKQAILDYTHRNALTPYIDYFIQAAQEEITNDIFSENFGKGLRFMEAVYQSHLIDGNGNVPVPSDWLAPKDFTLTGPGGVYDLEFRDTQWIYERYPSRAPQGTPAYISLDVSQGYPTLAKSLTLAAGSGQTIFDVSFLDAVLLATLDGSVLVPAADYSIAGNSLALIHGAEAGQNLYIQSVSSAGQPLAITATDGQDTFDISSLTGVVIFAVLDGAILVPGVDYSIDSGTLTLTASASAGQTLYVVSGVSSDYIVTGTAAGQIAFDVIGLQGKKILFAALDGSVLFPEDYTLSGNVLMLVDGVAAGQVLYVQAEDSTDSTSDVFIFGPYPDSSYSVQGAYYSQAPVLSASQPTNWIVTKAPSMLLACCMRQAGKFLKDVAMVEGWTSLYQDALEKLIQRDVASRFGEVPLTIRVA